MYGHELQHGGSASGSWVLPAESPLEFPRRAGRRSQAHTVFVYIAAQHRLLIVIVAETDFTLLRHGFVILARFHGLYQIRIHMSKWLSIR